MKLGTEDKKKLITLGVVGTGAIFALVYIYSQFSTPSVPAAPVAPVIVSAAPAARGSAAAPQSSSTARAGGSSAPGRRAAGKVGTTAAQYDPTLRMEAMLVTESLVYSGSGRNIFSVNSAPAVEIPKAIASARPHGPAQPVAQIPTGPPPPPPIDLKFFGIATAANGMRRAFLLHGEDVFLASAGDVVQRRYKVDNISANSIEVEDLTDNNRQTLPLQKQ
jgi:hypothetical protein